jgi:POT family proton-dependent oligopeptide transporter
MPFDATIEAPEAAMAEVKNIGVPAPLAELENSDTGDMSSTGHTECILNTPTDEELETLRRIPARISWIAFTIAFVELCERFAYYGTTAVCKYTK